jgi:hypothetical protein
VFPGFCCAVVLVIWFRGLLGVWLLRVVCGCFGWCFSVCGGSGVLCLVRFLVVGCFVCGWLLLCVCLVCCLVVVLLLVLFCFGLSAVLLLVCFVCGCWCVSPPGWFMLLLVRVLLLVDLGCFSSSWFFFLTFSATPGLGWLSWFLVFF